MRRRLGRRFILNAKYGAGLPLLSIDVVIAVIVAIDALRLGRLGIPYGSFVARSLSVSSFGLSSLYRYCVLLLLPLVVSAILSFAVFRYAPRRHYRRTASATRRSWLLMLHLAVSVGATIHLSVIGAATRLAGLCGHLGHETECFTPRLAFIDDPAFLGGSILTLLVVPVYSLFIKDSIWKNRELLREVAFWRLIGPAGEYQPQYGDELVYVNSASMAPSIVSINGALRHYHDMYQRAVPTSDKARDLLLQKAEDARKLLYEYLLPGRAEQQKLLHIEFFPGTSRALETGLLRIPELSHVVFSQYEHPSQVDVVRWLKATRGGPSYAALLPQSLRFFQGSWDTQRNAVRDALVEEIVQHPTGRVAVVLSEVHFMTGIKVNVAELMNEVRELVDNVVFVVDGSQAVGNLREPLGAISVNMQEHDLYYFSAHKWLLAPNTCGALVSRVQPPSMVPYDAFGFGLPTSTVDPNTILGLASALEFLLDEHRWLDRTLFDRFSERSRYSLEYFGELVEKSGDLEVIESVTGPLNASFFVVVRPRAGYRWKADMEAFWTHMRGCGVDLTVLPEARPYFDSDATGRSLEYFVRVSFPYFLLGANVRSLLRHLRAFVTRVNP